MAGQLDKTRAALVERFRDNWNAAASRPTEIPLTNVEMPNRKFSREPSKPFARLSIAFSDRSNAAIGGAKIRLGGFLQLQVFQPEGSGTKILTDAGDAFASIFDNATFSHLEGTGKVICHAMTTNETGPRDGYVQANYAVPFYTDENR